MSDSDRKRKAEADLAELDVQRRRGELVDRAVVRELLATLTAGHAAHVERMFSRLKRSPALEALPVDARGSIVELFEGGLRADAEDWRQGCERLRAYLAGES